jgi:hypothetical protein
MCSLVAFWVFVDPGVLQLVQGIWFYNEKLLGLSGDDAL